MIVGHAPEPPHGCSRVLLCALLAMIAVRLVAASSTRDPFAFFQPTLTVSDDNRQQLDQGEPVADVLSATGGETGVWAAVRVDIDANRLVAWMRRIELLKKSSYVEAIGRFSSPPQLSDLSRLRLDERDVDAVSECRPGSCGLKLSASEMAQLRVAARNGRSKEDVQEVFRTLLLHRVTAYLRDGDAALPPFEDHDGPLPPADTFAGLIGNLPFLAEHAPAVASHLRGYPRAEMTGSESFIYWSKERLDGKAIISATHVTIFRSDDPNMPDPLVTGKGLFALHYLNASLGITALLHGADGQRYLVYVNRTDLDVIQGVFGGVIRWFVQRHVRSESGRLLLGLKERLESGEPRPDVATDN